MNVSFTDLKRTFERYQDEYEDAALRALRSGWYILGTELDAFEREFADYLGMRHCVGVGNGQASLILAVRALGIGPGDEVIVAGNTYIATVLGVTENGATPVFVDCNEWFEIDENIVEAAITNRTKAVLITNLYGQCANLGRIRDICDKHSLYMLEDCAQSHGASFEGKLGGTVGDVACFSFYPTKPLGAFGDAGAVVTNDDVVAERLRMLRNYGSKVKYHNEVTGINSRLDEIQAAILRVGLVHLDENNTERARIAGRYLMEIKNPLVRLPETRDGAVHAFHIFALLCEQRDALAEHLKNKGIGTQVHYPIPPHLAECYQGMSFTQDCDLPLTERYAQQELSLPIYCGMPEEDIDVVISAVNSFEGR
jgi:dTDP-4-amino-4,6-dideoxygalactose transaminase